ncbi:MAG: DEAD/DEAH box helicase [Pseudomonadota bacterium]
MQFSELNLDPKVLKAVDEAGYTTPTPIQAQAIPHALEGRDVLGIAQTGTGKTASFTLPMITALAKGRARARMPRSLILCPTRELAAQVSENFETYGKYHKLSMALLIGGVNFANQDKLIDRGVDVLIATPGRLLDHFERGKLMLTGIQVMVVDEADRMLDMGFIPDIERIFNLTPFTRQTLFFSATMPPEITRLTDTFLSNPVRVEVARQATTAETVTQALCAFRPSRKDNADKEKRNCLRALIDGEGDALTNAIIFCNRKRDVGIVFKSLEKHGYSAGALHGDLDQSVRMATLNAFRDGQIRILVASDVAARGLDIPSVSHVFNYDVPTHSEDYVHRIGRTGRAGREGKAFTIALPADEKYVGFIEDLIKREISKVDLPDGVLVKEDDRRRRRSEDDRQESGEKASSRREDRAPRRSRDDEPRKETAPKDNARKDNARGDKRRRGGRRDDHGAPVMGMGDHVPAFLMREIRPKKAADPASDAEQAVEATEPALDATADAA